MSEWNVQRKKSIHESLMIIEKTIQRIFRSKFYYAPSVVIYCDGNANFSQTDYFDPYEVILLSISL